MNIINDFCKAPYIGKIKPEKKYSIEAHEEKV